VGGGEEKRSGTKAELREITQKWQNFVASIGFCPEYAILSLGLLI
jgi:hypothetical protein